MYPNLTANILVEGIITTNHHVTFLILFTVGFLESIEIPKKVFRGFGNVFACLLDEAIPKM